MSKVYKVQGEPTRIVATSRCAIKIKDNYYTIEATEERSIASSNVEVNMGEEWKDLFDSINDIVDNQIQDIVSTFQKK